MSTVQATEHQLIAAGVISFNVTAIRSLIDVWSTRLQEAETDRSPVQIAEIDKFLLPIQLVHSDRD